MVGCNSIVNSQATTYAFQYPTYDKEEFRQRALISLIKCIKKFNPNKNTKFTTFVYMVVKRGIISNIIRSYTKKRKNKGIVSLDDKIDTYSENSSTIGELIPDPNAQQLLNTYITKDTLKQIYELLNKEEQSLIDAWLLCEGKIINQYLKMDDETCSAIYRRLFRHIRDLVVNVVSKIDYQRIT
jgi:RNA polymerase sigma factor (sigma-70 family)